ncbi:MAG TPA: aminodeoxychorismate/anthranilate synthase component II, partial [Desulfurivibrionaceae bacterium]|nr:aminodeoxychorismate/anthranilate synthase component II [Desulfurivibrionaceae bacterium]
MIVIIDNYDSFTYNIVQTLGGLGAKMEIFRNDRIDVAGIAALDPDRLLISPGPCTPAQAGVSIAAIKHFAGKIPVLGVCLGHQSIGEAFGGKVVRAGRLMHGKTSPIFHDGRGVFTGLPSPFEAMRYHSLVVEEESLPDCLEITARTDQNELMGLRHKT